MQTIATTKGPNVEIVSAYSTQNQRVPAYVGIAEPWIIIGSFFLPVSVRCRLEAIGLVSVSTISMAVRIFDVTTAQEVGRVLVPGLVDTRYASGLFDAVGNRTYQFQAAILTSVASAFGLVRAAQLV